MTVYFLAKDLHVVGAIVILGTGAGIAFFMLMAHRSADAGFIARTAQAVVIADAMFTLTAVLLAIGAFVILDFAEATDPAVVYVETLAGDIYLEEGSDVERYTLAFDRLVAAALHPDESVQLIERLASTLR